VHDLFAHHAHSSPHDLREIVATLVQPESWKDAGGPGVLLSVPGGFVVHGSAKTHGHVTRLLDRLRRAHDPLVTQYDPFARSPEELRLYQALDQKVSLEANETALKDVIAKLSEQVGVPLEISQKKLEE